jgi:hypothetical protein
VCLHVSSSHWLVIACQTFVKVGPARIPSAPGHVAHPGGQLISFRPPKFERGGAAILAAAGWKKFLTNVRQHEKPLKAELPNQVRFPGPSEITTSPLFGPR